MVNFKNGDIVLAEEQIICHQVNCLGVMGDGLAKTVKNKLLLPCAFIEYKELCELHGASNLGDVFFTEDTKTYYPKTVANCFAQNGIGRHDCHTNYTALELCLDKVNAKAYKENTTVAIPYGMGCGLGGGDWDTVLGIINKTFTEVECNIYQL